eukprot:3990592-Pleurochrysis_carterae.AAC.2
MFSWVMFAGGGIGCLQLEERLPLKLRWIGQWRFASPVGKQKVSIGESLTSLRRPRCETERWYAALLL